MKDLYRSSGPLVYLINTFPMIFNLYLNTSSDIPSRQDIFHLTWGARNEPMFQYKAHILINIFAYFDGLLHLNSYVPFYNEASYSWVRLRMNLEIIYCNIYHLVPTTKDSLVIPDYWLSRPTKGSMIAIMWYLAHSVIALSKARMVQHHLEAKGPK